MASLSVSRDDTRDLALIVRLRQDDAEACEILVRLYGAALMRYAASIVGSDDFAQDVVQEVFQQLWLQRKDVKFAGSVAPYLYRLTKHRAIDMIRARRSAERREGDWLQQGDVEESNLGEQTIAMSDTRALLERELRDVPPRCREIFFLVWDHQLSYADVAAMLDISVLTARNQMSRAVRHLAERLR